MQRPDLDSLEAMARSGEGPVAAGLLEVVSYARELEALTGEWDEIDFEALAAEAMPDTKPRTSQRRMPRRRTPLLGEDPNDVGSVYCWLGCWAYCGATAYIRRADLIRAYHAWCRDRRKPLASTAAIEAAARRYGAVEDGELWRGFHVVGEWFARHPELAELVNGAGPLGSI